jgi:hypothetical protein
MFEGVWLDVIQVHDDSHGVGLIFLGIHLVQSTPLGITQEPSAMIELPAQ